MSTITTQNIFSDVIEIRVSPCLVLFDAQINEDVSRSPDIHRIHDGYMMYHMMKDYRRTSVFISGDVRRLNILVKQCL